MKKRKVTQIVRGRNTVDGAGVHLRRILGEQTVHDFDPFLMLDGFYSTNPQDYIKGFPWHPHRGIETVTYLVIHWHPMDWITPLFPRLSSCFIVPLTR